MAWFTYMACCKDGSLYTGITTDLSRREKEHNTNDRLGAKSIRHKRPVKMVYYEIHPDQSTARKREAEIKKWKRDSKLKLLNSNKGNLISQIKGTVYILKSLKNNRLYIGSTTIDVYQRLERHNKGDVRSTNRYRPFKLEFYQAYEKISDARKIEVKLKRLKRRDYIEKIISEKCIRMGP